MARRSWPRSHGWRALPYGVELIVGLCERFWDDVHPLPRDGDAGYRAAPLAWLAGAYADVPAARVELFEGREGMRGTLAQRQAAQREAHAARARQDVPAAKREAATRAATAMNEAARAAAPRACNSNTPRSRPAAR